MYTDEIVIATTNGPAASLAPAGLPEHIKKMLDSLPPDQAKAAARYVNKQHAVVDDGIPPQMLEIASTISTYQLKREKILYEEILPRLNQLIHLGHRMSGPTIAFRWVDAQLKSCRAAWKGLSKTDYKARLEEKRREIRLTPEFAQLFPSEAYTERRESGGAEPAAKS